MQATGVWCRLVKRPGVPSVRRAARGLTVDVRECALRTSGSRTKYFICLQAASVPPPGSRTRGQLMTLLFTLIACFSGSFPEPRPD